MGYSCTKAANDTLDAVSFHYQTNGNPNILTIGNTVYFFERGREQSDGAITGELMRMLPNDYCERAGSVKIAPDGSIIRFPAINKKEVNAFLADVRAGKVRVSILGGTL